MQKAQSLERHQLHRPRLFPEVRRLQELLGVAIRQIRSVVERQRQCFRLLRFAQE